jgi:hypothetical protein
MAVHRIPPKCPKCKQPIKGIYRDESHLPPYQKTIGDTFLRWDFEGHVCKQEIKTKEE